MKNEVCIKKWIKEKEQEPKIDKEKKKKKPIWIKNLKRHNKKMNQNKKQKN